jgi:hypothetical protein
MGKKIACTPSSRAHFGQLLCLSGCGALHSCESCDADLPRLVHPALPALRAQSPSAAVAGRCLPAEAYTIRHRCRAAMPFPPMRWSMPSSSARARRLRAAPRSC